MTQNDFLRPIPGYEGRYSITRDGRVLSVARTIPHGDGVSKRSLKAKWLKDSAVGKGYRGIHLYDEGCRKTLYIHVLVIEAFGLPKPTPDHEVNHKNFDRADNHDTNLEWVTRGQNLHYTRVNGRGFQLPALQGEDHGVAKLTARNVLEIRRLHEGGVGPQKIARKFGIVAPHVWRIVTRKAWRHI